MALVLLSMLMLVLVGAMRALGQTETRVEQRIEQAEDYRLANSILHDTLTRVSARKHSVNGNFILQRAPFFRATQSSLSWIGVMPARFGMGGRHYLRLRLEKGDFGDVNLVLRYAPWDGNPSYDAWAQASGQILAWSVRQFSLSYLDPMYDTWFDMWPPPGVQEKDLPRNLLPAAIMIRLSDVGGRWPPIIIPVSAAFLSDANRQLGTWGG